MTNPGFRLAKSNFDANINALKQPSHNPELWNLSTGLSQLAAALEQELEAIHLRLNALDNAVKNIR